MVPSLTGKRVIVASVARGPYLNYGNQLIERASLRLLGLGEATPVFSVFEPLTPDLVRTINGHDLLIFTGCTILEDHPGHQSCFDGRFHEITVPKFCFAGSFCTALNSEPSLRIANLFDGPLAVRDPWTAGYLRRAGLPHVLVGCPTLLDVAGTTDWRAAAAGRTLVSSTPELDPNLLSGLRDADVEYVSHSPGSPGIDVRRQDLFHEVGSVITGRLHLALPALARGIRVRFYGPPYWLSERARSLAGPSRFTLLSHLAVSLDGDSNRPYPLAELRVLRENLFSWFECLASS